MIFTRPPNQIVTTLLDDNAANSGCIYSHALKVIIFYRGVMVVYDKVNAACRGVLGTY